jgi:DNA (cytosine-5)-methyltransferase 1
MTVGSLFAGIGGFDLAASWVGWKTAWYSEIEPYACAVMRKRYPQAINHGDITAIDGRTIEPVDILCGGFPCQDISTAGKNAGIGGSRSGLWKQYARLIKEISPRFVVIENVSVLRSRGLDTVLQDLDEIGYDAEWNCIPASYVGAPHQRDRIWIVAYPNSKPVEHLLGGCSAERSEETTPARPVDVDDASSSASRTRRQNVADAYVNDGERRTRQGAYGQGRWSSATQPENVRQGRQPRSDNAGPCSPLVADSSSSRLEGHTWNGGAAEGRSLPIRSTGSCGLPQGADGEGWWQSEPNVGRVANGVPSRVDRIKCLGNAIVPQVAYEIFRAIERHG